MHIIKERLQQAREQAGLSLGQACKLVGISRSTLWRAENDSDAMPEVDTLIQLAKTYGVSLDWLAGTSGELPRDLVMEIRLKCSSEDAKQLIALYESLEGARDAT